MGFGFTVLKFEWCTKYFYCVPFFLILGIGSFWKRKFVAGDVTGIFNKPKTCYVRKVNIKLQRCHNDMLIVVVGKILVVCQQQYNCYIDFEILDKQIYSGE